MSTPITPLPADTYANFVTEPPTTVEIDPDNPPWGWAMALMVWLSSLFLMILLPVVAIIPYAIYKYAGTDLTRINEQLAGDPNFLLISLLATIPAHLLTLGIVWAVVSRFGKRPFWRTIGWSWTPGFGFWMSFVVAIGLLVVGGVVAWLIPGEKTPFEQMLESSVAARFATAFMATATAPLVEELVYRGVLYPALRKSLGMAWAFMIVSVMFAAVHVSQYYNNIGVIAAVSMLAFALTYVRARTGRVLPGFIIHLVFNGIQVGLLILQYFFPSLLSDGANKTGFFLFLLVNSPFPLIY